MGKIIFITGGVRSGKSAFAENYAKKLFRTNKSEQLIYIASGVAFDEEMKNRIKRHQQDRVMSEIKWKTIEIVDRISNETSITSNDTVLWDCITTWLSNVLYQTEELEKKVRVLQIERYIDGFQQQLLSWKNNGVTVLLVSNEVLDEESLKISDVHLYRSILGYLHQWIITICDEAYEMDYGIHRRWK